MPIMKRYFGLMFLLLFSCDYFESKKVKTEDIVSQEREAIDWTAVDEYPSFDGCEDLVEKLERKQCFEHTILNHVNQFLSEQMLVVSEDVEDTISIKLKVDKRGEISVLKINSKPETQLVIPTIDSLLTQSIASLPKIYPAIKRGQQVKTEFVLPVVVSIK